MKIGLIVFGLLINFISRGQEIVKGIVVYRQEPMPGVFVTENGTNNEVFTDSQGKFEIKIKTEKPTLTFIYVGFRNKTVKVKANKVLKIKMKSDIKKLREATAANNVFMSAPAAPGTNE